MSLYKKIFILFFLCYFTFLLFSQAGAVGEIKILENGNGVIKFGIYDISVSKMKGKSVYFAFKISQNGKPLENSYLTVVEQDVIYDPAYWNGEAFWFRYNYDNIIEGGGIANNIFKGTFYIMDGITKKPIFKKDISFTLNFNETEGANMESNYKDFIIEYGESKGYTISIYAGKIYEKKPTGKTIPMDNNPLSANYIYETETKSAVIVDSDIKAIIDIFNKNGWYSLKSEMDSMDRYDYVWLRLKDEKDDITIYQGTSKMSGNKIPDNMQRIINYIKGTSKYPFIFLYFLFSIFF